MTRLLVIKQYIKYYVARYEVYLQPLAKFALAYIVLQFANGATGYMDRLNSTAVVFVAALTCSFMPPNFMVIMVAGFVVAHMYVVSLECAAVVLAIFLLLFLLFFRFSPRDTLAVLLTPICFSLNIPYVIPLMLGLLGTPLSIVSAICGVVAYYSVSYITANITTVTAMAADDMAVRFRFIIDGILDSQEMLVMTAAFSVTIIVIYFIRRLPITHNWLIAMVTGGLVHILILLLGDLIWDVPVGVGGAVFGMIISIGIAKVIEFFVFHVDYNSTEKVQFEDDDYYYYVKAVPKVTVAAPSRKVRKIHTRRSKEEEA
ncbi:MAG: hypothetical protein LBC96_00900 [Lachnospiraceae bacterium]|jgi:hypothetical protein|nr:hypothetical protein [Lachnospiraceae bacterium]